jgi:hypothetical protein
MCPISASHPDERRYCEQAKAEAIAQKGLDIMDSQALLIIIILVPRIMLEFNNAAPGGMMLSDHAARTNHWRRGRDTVTGSRHGSEKLNSGFPGTFSMASRACSRRSPNTRPYR